jgi:hypothetical protein
MLAPETEKKQSRCLRPGAAAWMCRTQHTRRAPLILRMFNVGSSPASREASRNLSLLGNGRYLAYSRYKSVTDPLPKRLHIARSAAETRTAFLAVQRPPGLYLQKKILGLLKGVTLRHQHTHTHTHTHTHKYTHAHVIHYVHACMCVHACAYIHIYIYIHVHAYICLYMYMHIHCFELYPSTTWDLRR